MKVTRCEFVHNLPCEQVSGRLTELEAENAKLRERIDAAHMSRLLTENENESLRELLAGAFEDMVAWQRVIACSNEWGYGRGCREQLFELRDAMRDLGVEVDFDGR